MARLKSNIVIKNKKAEFEYFLLEKYTAGIVLTGTEIKSIREAKANLGDAYALFIGNELFVKNMHISEYSFGTYLNHEPKRDRKLLLTTRELKKLQTKIKTKGLTIVPVCLFIDENGRAKLEVALAKGKKSFDKRQSLKEKDIKREMASSVKHF